MHLGGKEVQAHYFGRGHTQRRRRHLLSARARHPHRRPVPRTSAPARAAAARRRGRRACRSTWTTRRAAASSSGRGRSSGTLALDFDTVIPGHGPVATKADLAQFKADLETMRGRLTGSHHARAPRRPRSAKVLEDDYGWRSTGCPPSPPTGGCLQYQQLDALIAELRARRTRRRRRRPRHRPPGGDHHRRSAARRRQPGDRSLAAVLDMTRRLLTPFRDQRVPVIGFVNQGRAGGAST